ncbi:MAG: response regulator transcription factor [Akkermansiaceae bacterium]
MKTRILLLLIFLSLLVHGQSSKGLLAKVRSLLRRQERAEVPEVVVLGEVEIRLTDRCLVIGGVATDLNQKEVGILKLLLEFRRQVVSRDRFLDEVWGYHANPTSRTADNFIAELRKKLGKDGEALKTVRGEGYRLD